jgi:diguanylate cyclase (GGDEF)-like protein
MTDVSQQIAALTQMYLDSLPEKLDQILDDIQLLEDEETGAIDRVYKAIHEIAGSAGCFGLPEVSVQASSIENNLLKYIKEETSPPKDVIELIKVQAKKLIQSQSKAPNNAVATDLGFSYTNEATSKIYVLDDDPDYGHLLVKQLNQIGYSASYFSNIDSFVAEVKREKPDVTIIDAILDEGDFTGFKRVAKLKQVEGIDVPVIAISSRSDFDAQVQAVRAGADYYFLKPTSIDELATAIEIINVDKQIGIDFRILIIDDDEKIAQHFSLILQQAGMEVKIITDPRMVLESIALFDPELIITDVNMPGCSGIELAKIIRFHIEYLHIPIVYLSTESRIAEHKKALDVGGDEFLTKPIKPKKLINSILTRVRRARQVSNLVHQDSLTGLLKHSAIRESIDRELKRSKRSSEPLIFAMIDLDHFKQVNDTYGHLVGDQVIKRMSKMLKLRFRTTDYVARYGGEEFAVLLTDCSEEAAYQLFEDLRISFSQMNFVADHKTFHVSCSVGIVKCQTKFSIDQICSLADKALYIAKDQGRNQVVKYRIE